MRGSTRSWSHRAGTNAYLALEWIDEEELVEVTPHSVRLRHRVLETALRNKHRAGLQETMPAAALSEGD